MAVPALISSANLGQAGYNDGAVVAFDFSALSPSDGDTVVIFTELRSQGSACSLTPPAGYTIIDSVATSGNGALFVISHVWHTGDATNPSFTMHGTTVGDSAARFAVLLRPSSGSTPVAVDGAPAHSTASSVTSIASSSLNPTRPSDLYFAFYGCDSTHDGTWTGPPTLTSLFTTGANPGEISTQLAYGTFSGATGTFTAGTVNHENMRQISVLFNVPPIGGSRASGLIYCI
jgi:hypothetical protein